MRKGVWIGLILGIAFLGACGGSPNLDGRDGSSSTTSTAAPTTTAAASTTEAPTTTTTTELPATSEAPSTTSTTGSTTTPPTGQAVIRIDEIVFAGGPYLLLSNQGNGIGSTEGYFICRFPNYFGLPEVELAPGERMAVPLGDTEVPDLVGVVSVVPVTSPLGEINPQNDELGLYSHNEFNSPDAILDYVEWGAPGHARSSVAVRAGIWVEGGFVAVPDEVLAIVAQAFPTQGPDDWFAEIGG